MNCKKCKSSYEVPEAQKAFLGKLNLPEPQLCPDCRRQRRAAFRNERQLYHRKCDLTGKAIISIYNAESPYKVYQPEAWYGDGWNGLDYGRDFDFSRPFFEQFGELIKATPKLSVFASRNENSDFTNGAQQDKDCYMIFVSDHDENCYYSYGIDSCKDCIECLNCYKCTLCIECIDSTDCYNVAYGEKSHNCSDSYFIFDCRNCRNCFGCYGLRGKEYYIFNEPHTKEEYEKKLAELNTGSAETIAYVKDVVAVKVAKQQVHQYYDGVNNQNVTGDHIVNSKNCIECYDGAKTEDCGYLFYGHDSKDCWDGYVVVEKSELCYETISTVAQYNTQFTFVSLYSKNGMYLDHCVSTEDCFGCSSLKKARYCILNKQYTKEEYEKLKAKIIEHMKTTGEWGQPLPAQFSPFGYNETAAQELYPLKKEEALAQKFNWMEGAEKKSAYKEPVTKIPNDIREVQDDITTKVLICEKSGKPYKIIAQELEAYRQHKLPLPRLCFDERHLARMAKRNPKKLWKRECSSCGASLMSPYSPDRPEKIICEACYLKATY